MTGDMIPATYLCNLPRIASALLIFYMLNGETTAIRTSQQSRPRTLSVQMHVQYPEGKTDICQRSRTGLRLSKTSCSDIAPEGYISFHPADGASAGHVLLVLVFLL